MEFEKYSLSTNEMFSSQAIMKRLVQKYQVAAQLLLQHGSLQNISNEILMLLKTPQYRLLLEKKYTSIHDLKFSNAFNYEDFYDVKLEFSSIMPTNNQETDLISPAPFITSLLNLNVRPDSSVNDNLLNIMCNKLQTLNYLPENWRLKSSNVNDKNLISRAILDLGKILVEPIEDIAFNIRYIALLEQLQSNNISKNHGVSFTLQFLPGIIFLGGSIMRDIPKMIEAIYHETLHIKFINTLQAFEILNYNLLSTATPFICPWRKCNNEWPFLRAIAAFHVYCYLLAFHNFVILKNYYFSAWCRKRIHEITMKIDLLKKYINNSTNVLTAKGIEYFELLSNINVMC